SSDLVALGAEADDAAHAVGCSVSRGGASVLDAPCPAPSGRPPPDSRRTAADTPPPLSNQQLALGTPPASPESEQKVRPRTPAPGARSEERRVGKAGS